MLYFFWFDHQRKPIKASKKLKYNMIKSALLVPFCSNNTHDYIFSLFMCLLVYHWCHSWEFGLVSQWDYDLQSPFHPPAVPCGGRRSMKRWGFWAQLLERGRKMSDGETFLFSSLILAPLADHECCESKARWEWYQWPFTITLSADVFVYRADTKAEPSN